MEPLAESVDISEAEVSEVPEEKQEIDERIETVLQSMGPLEDKNGNCNGRVAVRNALTHQMRKISALQNQSAEDFNRVFNMLEDDEEKDEELTDMRYPKTADDFNKAKPLETVAIVESSRQETSFHHVPTLMDDQVRQGAHRVERRELKDESDIMPEDSSMQSESHSQAKNVQKPETDSQIEGA